ncbi:MAG: hypothetical protein OZSIB_3400 [Candidatus Ozemobacter sibiricus]|uniref:Uncharacterized protein n=1 Tax=Candidatus Ozemobacter sibiricus TaxID=2268124 RepID=A0A367ZQ06_9BACT|nr:MAG: hypothetical protein OZSIB_3400 [Candidatus Ozemobacter sibiricus]
MKTSLADGFYAVFDVGSYAVKAILIERRSGKDRVVALESELVQPLGEFPGEAEFREHLVQQLKLVAARLPMGEIRECLSVFNSRELQAKLVEPPSQVPPDKLPSVLAWEAKKLLSPTYRNEPFMFGWRLLRESPPSAILAVIPQAILQRHDDLYTAAGIHLTGTYAEVFGSLALKEGSANLGLPALSLINLGHAGTHLQIFASGELKFYRFIPSGAGDFSQPALPGEMEGFAQKIRFSFDYFRAVSKLGHIDELRLYGGGATRPEFFSFARDYFAPGKVDTLDVSNAIDISPILPQMAEPPGPGPRHVKLLPFLPALGVFRAHADPAAPAANLQARLHELAWEARMARLTALLPLWLGLSGAMVVTIVLLFWRISLADQLDQVRQKANITANDLISTRVRLTRLHQARVPEVKLSPRDQSALQPFLRPQRSADEILFLAERKRPPGLRLTRILIQSRSQNEDEIAEEEEAAPDQSQGAPADGDEAGQPAPPPPPSGPSQAQEQETIDDPGGEFLTIHGWTRGYEGLAAFAEGLVQARVLRRIRQLRLVPKGSGDQRFILKGELP